MKKLYGLKDEDGKDVVLNIESVYGRKTATAFDIVEIKTVEKEPEFKVGQWVWQLHAKWVEKSHRKAKLFRINHITNGLLYSDEGLPYKPQYSVLATPQEIEAHLKEIAIEKGFKDGVIAKFPNGMGKRELHGSFRYDPNWLTTEDCLSMGYNVIWRPKYGWVEILPSLKKLPKTKEELSHFVDDWNKETFTDMTFEKFLDQYEGN